MEQEPQGVTYSTFEALAFVPPSLEQTFRLVVDTATNKGLRAKVVIVWITIASSFVLAFPTLASAMSGYSTNVDAFVLDHQQKYVPWHDFDAVQFWLNDGWRVGEAGRFPITDNPASFGTCKTRGPELFHYERDLVSGRVEAIPVPHSEQAWEQMSSNCTLFWRTIECKSYILRRLVWMCYGWHVSNELTNSRW